ncbi:MAG: helix-turn-helix domain-containing protein [Alphaproteobacteria bacterium]|nr:helix-turn-helix domain-containing protein [Alphaproteobacteria bacterium]
MTGGGKTGQLYHYVESGLDNIYLADGFEFIDRPAGRELRIVDIDGLHKAIGTMLVTAKKNLSGKEIRFLRKEMSISQSKLARLLEVSEQTVHRWEKGKGEFPKSAEMLIRLLYREHTEKGEWAAGEIRRVLEEVADLKDMIDGHEISLRLVPGPPGIAGEAKGWGATVLAAA